MWICFVLQLRIARILYKHKKEFSNSLTLLIEFYLFLGILVVENHYYLRNSRIKCLNKSTYTFQFIFTWHNSHNAIKEDFLNQHYKNYG